MYCDEHGTVDYCPECSEDRQEIKILELQKENNALVERWDKIKDLIQLTVDLYGDDDDIDCSVSEAILDEMNKLEEITGGDNG